MIHQLVAKGVKFGTQSFATELDFDSNLNASFLFDFAAWFADASSCVVANKNEEVEFRFLENGVASSVEHQCVLFQAINFFMFVP